MRLEKPIKMGYSCKIRGLKHRFSLIVAGLFGEEMTIGGYISNIPKNIVDKVLEEYD